MKGPKKKKLIVYHTPGRECAHADKGCCPTCFSPQVFRRFISRQIMPPVQHVRN